MRALWAGRGCSIAIAICLALAVGPGSPVRTACNAGLPYSEAFETTVGDDPADWFDTGAGNSTAFQDLFSVFDVGGDLALFAEGPCSKLAVQPVGDRRFLVYGDSGYGA